MEAGSGESEVRSRGSEAGSGELDGILSNTNVSKNLIINDILSQEPRASPPTTNHPHDD